MTRRAVRQRQATERTRPRARDESPDDPVLSDEARRRAELADPRLTDAGRRRLAATICGWCGSRIKVKARGRIPTWCSPACRQRAWEQQRAAASGLAAVRVVERRVEFPVPVVPTASAPRHREWPVLLRQLAAQLDNGALYNRDLPELTGALNDVIDAFQRRNPRHP